MYTIYVDSTLVYSDAAPELEELKLIAPKLTIDTKNAGSFTATFPTTNVGYNLLTPLASTIDIFRGEDCIWTGRPITVDTDFYNYKKVTCEGALAYLNDILVPMASYQTESVLRLVHTLMDIYNAKVPRARQIQVGNISTSTNTGAAIDKKAMITDNRSVLDCITEIADEWGLYLRVGKKLGGPVLSIDLINSDTFPLSSQTIDFGVNLLDYTSTNNWDEIVTAIMPLGANLESYNESGDERYPDRVTIARVNGGDRYLQNPTAIQAYGRVEKTVDFQDVDDPATLKKLAQLYFEDLQYNDTTIEITVLDLNYLNIDVEAFKLYTKINCISKPHNLNKTFIVSKMEIPFDTPENTTFTLSRATYATYGSDTVQTKSTNLSGTLATIPKITDFRKAARDNATNLINMATNGYVTLVPDSKNTHTESLVIADNRFIENATRKWTWNVNGFMHQKRSSIDEEWESANVAITMDGEIVADMITTGVIRAGDNYINLDTGEARLAMDAKVVDPDGVQVVFEDIIADAQNGANKRVGSTNLLNGTKKLDSKDTSGDWSKSSWAPTGFLKVVNVDPPNNNLTRGYQATGAWTLRQINIPVENNDDYVLSVYAKGSGDLGFGIGKPSDADISVTMVPDGIDEYWNKYYIRFRVDDTKIENGKTAVRFKGSGQQYIAGMKLERGTTPSDWSPSPDDEKNQSAEHANDALVKANENATQQANKATIESAKYTDKAVKEEGTNITALANKRMDGIAKDAKAYTDRQKLAIDGELTQKKIFDRLTGGGKVQGLYLHNGKVYINGTYIQSGYINAGIVTAGILKDVRGDTRWNLATGYFKTKNADLVNCDVVGTLTSGSSSSNEGNAVQFRNGTIRFFNGSKNAVTIDGALQFNDGNYGGHVTFSKYLVFRGPALAVDTNTKGRGSIGFTGTISARNLVTDMADGMTRCTMGPMELRFVHGMLVDVSGPFQINNRTYQP